VQTIPWGQRTGKAKVLPDPCGGGTLQGLKVNLTGVGTRSSPTLEGFLVIKKEEEKVLTNKPILITNKNQEQNPKMRLNRPKVQPMSKNIS
jgi:hypothetical protein